MNIQSHEVAESMWHEHGSHPHLHHGIHIPFQNARLTQLFQLHSFRQLVHVDPAHPRLDGCHYCTVSLEDSIVDEFLLLAELAIGRKGTSDVTGVTAILASQVKQTAEYDNVTKDIQ